MTSLGYLRGVFFKVWCVLLLQQKDLRCRVNMQIWGLQVESEFLGVRPRDLRWNSLPGDSDLSVQKFRPHLGSLHSESITRNTRVISCCPRVPAMCQLHPCAGGPARTWNFLPSPTGGGAFYGMAFNESLYPSFTCTAVYTVHSFPHKSTSVNHSVICLFLEMTCDYIKQCSHKKSSYSSNNCLKTYILTAFPRQCTFGTKSVMKA